MLNLTRIIINYFGESILQALISRYRGRPVHMQKIKSAKLSPSITQPIPGSGLAWQA